MKMKLHRTAAARNAFAFGLTFLVGSAFLLGSTFLVTTRVLDHEANAVLAAEMEGLLEDYRLGGSAAIASSLALRMDGWGRSGALYLLADRGFRRIAGNLARWPFDGRPVDRWPGFSVTASENGGERPHPVRALVRELPDGNLVLVATDLQERRVLARRFGAAMAWSVVLVTGLAAIAGIALSRMVAERVAGVASACDSILAGDQSQRLPVLGTRDEFDSLAGAVNGVLARLQERTLLLRTTLDSIAHDLRAPLHRLRVRLEDLAAQPDQHGQAAGALERSLRDVDVLHRTLSTLLEIARAESGEGRAEFGVVDLTALARDVVDLFEPVARDQGASLTVAGGDPIRVRGDRQLLAQLLSNLVENALRHGSRRGRIEVSASERDGRVELGVRDDGPGIARCDRERAMQPFVRLSTAAAGTGSGLGLSLVAAVARLHGATIELGDNQPGLRVAVLFAPAGVEAGSRPAGAPALDTADA